MLSEKALPFLKNITQTIGVLFRELLSLREVEILQALQHELSTEQLKEIVKRREEMNIVLFTDQKGDVLVSEDPTDIESLRKAMIPRVDDEKEIKGQIGNKGTYTGPVCIVMDTHDFSKLKSGDVLVSTMTTPDFVVLMQKAGAIVTDIGGMLCHAAIVSREINKPCIIGSKFATRMLKDGDVVEVDATRGIVKVISRS
jgi:pyruvate,water dikinase